MKKKEARKEGNVTGHRIVNVREIPMLGVTEMRPMIASVPRQGKPLPRPSSVSTLPGCNDCASQLEIVKTLPYLRHVVT